MFEKCVLTILELNWNQRLGHKKRKLNICHHMLTSSKQLQNRSFDVVDRTRTSSKCRKLKNARAKRAKILFFIVKYANLWGFCCRRRRGCLSSLLQIQQWLLTLTKTKPSWRDERSPFNISIWRHPVFQTSRLSTCSYEKMAKGIINNILDTRLFWISI